MPAFVYKKSAFFGRNSTSTQNNIVTAVLVLFVFFVRQKVTFHEKVSFTEYAFVIRLPDGSKLVIKRKSDNGVTICRHDVTVKFF